MTTDTINSTRCCGEHLVLVDRYGLSATLRCTICQHATLVVDSSDFQLEIKLADFHLKRGDGEDQRPLSDFEMAHSLALSARHGTWPSAASCVDFGLASRLHYEAIRDSVMRGVTPYDLDRVLGDGPAITRLVHGSTGSHWDLEFWTPYDGRGHLLWARWAK